MKKVNIILPVFLLLLAIGFTIPLRAQEAAAKRKVEKDMEKKYADPQRKKGKEELKKITYENDKRFKDPTNKVQATLVFEDQQMDKKGKPKKLIRQRIVFGKTGECIVMNEGEKDEMRIIYNYADKANYMVSVKDKTAMKMPLINMEKMIEKGAQKETEKRKDVPSRGEWKSTGEKETINGFNCSKFIYTYNDNPRFSTMEAWMSTDVKLNLGDNYMLGARLSAYKFPANQQYKDMSGGFMVRSIMYDKKGNAVSQRDLTEFSKTADEKYFDLTGFQVKDLMDAL